jgi:Peptidase family C25
VAACALALASWASAARATPNIGITFETKGQITSTTPVTSLAYAHAVPSTGSNLALIVTVGSTNSTGDVGSVVWDPDTTISGNEQTLTCPVALDIVSGTSRRMAICTLMNPTTSSGHGQVTVTLTAADTFTSSATTMTGVASTATGTGSGGGKEFSTWSNCNGGTTMTNYVCTTPVTTVVDQVVFDMMGQGEATDNTTRTYTASGTGQHKHEDSASLSNNNNLRVATSITIATGTTTTLVWTCGGSTGTNGVGQVILLINAASSVTAARMGPIEAVRYGDAGVRVAWRTEEEVSHLGFRVWREVGGVRARLGGGLLPGSMFSTGDFPLGGRRPYELWDPHPVAGARYWLEEIATAGPSRFHGPIVSTTADPARVAAMRGASVPAAPALRPYALSSLDVQLPVSRRLTSTGVVSVAPATITGAPLHDADPTCANPPAWAPSVKIAVSATGWTRVEGAALVSAGLSADADPARLALYADGRPVAMKVIGDGRVDAVEFYGAGLDTRETATHVYWLVAGDADPRRVAIAARAPAGPITPSYAATIERRDRDVYFAALLNGPADNFFGATITDAPVAQTLDVSAPVTAAGTTATLEVALQGATLGAHDVGVSLGGVALGRLTWSGRAAAVTELEVPAGLLAAGTQTIALTPAVGASDVSIVDHLTLTYARLFEATGDTLVASVPAGASASLAGFSSADVRVVDLADPAAPVELPVAVTAAGDGTFTALVTMAAGGAAHRVLAFTGASVSSADAVTANHPSSLCATRGAELAVVAPAMFFDALAPFVAARRAAGWTVDLIDVEDVYDEMSYGAHTAAALTSFVRRRRAGPLAPRTRSLLLVGDASLDPRNFLGKDVPDLVPTRLIDTTTIETASDDALADLDGDGVPELAVGRWPARTPDDVSGFVTRTLSLGATTPFARGALVVAGASGGFDFSGPAEDVLAAAPGAGGAFLDVGALGGGARATLGDLWSRGPSFVAYLGHGSQGVWEDLLSMDDLSGTDPVGAPAVVASMTCLNGLFQDVYQDCLAERLMRADNGAAAVWASATLEDAGGESALALAFEGKLASLSLGEAARQTKAALPGASQAMILFGDPTLFGAPTPDVATTGLVTPPSGATQPLSDSAGGVAPVTPSAGATAAVTSPSSGCAVSGDAPARSPTVAALGLALALLALARRCRVARVARRPNER